MSSWNEWRVIFKRIGNAMEKKDANQTRSKEHTSSHFTPTEDEIWSPERNQAEKGPERKAFVVKGIG